jgi:hypothetical protein
MIPTDVYPRIMIRRSSIGTGILLKGGTILDLAQVKCIRPDLFPSRGIPGIAGFLIRMTGQSDKSAWFRVPEQMTAYRLSDLLWEPVVNDKTPRNTGVEGVY